MLAESDPPSTRQDLAAIVFLDIADYTRHMERDEANTHRQWMSIKRNIIDGEVAKNSGRVIKSTGDGLLVSFREPGQAADFSISVQDSIPLAGDQAGADRIALRMGINYGRIIVEDDDIYGNDVNIAARICSIAAKNEIVASQAYAQVLPPSDRYAHHDLGFFSLRHIERRVRLFRLHGASAAAQPPGPGHRPSVALLPFTPVKQTDWDPTVQHGIPIEIIGTISSMNEFFVISVGSTMTIEEAGDLSQLSIKLGVRYFVCGDYYLQNDSVFLDVRLIDTDTNSVVWNQVFSFRRAEVLDKTNEIASKIVHSLIPHVRLRDLNKARLKSPVNLDAYDLVIQGMYRMYKLTRRDFQEARRLFKRALEIDPHYSSAHTMMAMWHLFQLGEGLSKNAAADHKKALAYSLRALDFHPADPLALSIHGHSLTWASRQYDIAKGYFERALTASPNSAVAWGLSAPTYAYTGDYAEAVQRAKRALELSPIEPFTYFYRTALTLAHYFEGNFADAVVWGRKTYQQAPNFVANMRLYIASLSAAGEFAEAKRVAQHLLEVSPTFHVGEFCQQYPVESEDQRQQLRARLLAAGLPA